MVAIPVVGSVANPSRSFPDTSAKKTLVFIKSGVSPIILNENTNRRGGSAGGDWGAAWEVGAGDLNFRRLFAEGCMLNEFRMDTLSGLDEGLRVRHIANFSLVICWPETSLGRAYGGP